MAKKTKKAPAPEAVGVASPMGYGQDATYRYGFEDGMKTALNAVAGAMAQNGIEPDVWEHHKTEARRKRDADDLRRALDEIKARKRS